MAEKKQGLQSLVEMLDGAGDPDWVAIGARARQELAHASGEARTHLEALLQHVFTRDRAKALQAAKGAAAA